MDREIEEHELTHCPFPHCRAKEEDHQVKEFHIDLIFVKNVEEKT